MEGFVHADSNTQQLVERARKLAGCGLPILITGESGTGKEVLARGIHNESRLSRFVTIDCSVLNGDTARSEVYGAVRGAYTGATNDRVGLVERADKGTLFIDEVGEAGPGLQMMLLRFLQNGEYRRVGDHRTRNAQVRIIAATNRDLDKDVSSGRFREDLLYRLRVAHVPLPPLRHRRPDIGALIQYFLTKFESRTGQSANLSPQDLQHLLDRDWPGNVRELENTVAMILAGVWSGDQSPIDVAEAKQQWLQMPFKLARKHWEQEAIRDYLEARLTLFSGNVTRASESAEIGRQYFQAWMKRVGVDANNYRGSTPLDA